MSSGTPSATWRRPSGSSPVEVSGLNGGSVGFWPVRRLSDITHIGRIIDPRRPASRVAILAPLGAALIVFGLDTSDIGRAVVAGVSTFAAWAIARELDPDHPSSATIAAVLTPAATVLLGPPAVAALFVAMLTFRIVARTTGLPPRWTDLAVLTAGAVLFADTPWGWAAGILLAFAMVRDAALPGEPPPNAGLWGGLLAIGVTARVALADGLGTWETPATPALLVLTVGLAGAAIVLQPAPVLSLGDWTKIPLEPQRVREAALFGILNGVLATVAAGEAGIVAIAPLLLTFAAVAGYRVFERVATN